MQIKFKTVDVLKVSAPIKLYGHPVIVDCPGDLFVVTL